MPCAQIIRAPQVSYIERDLGSPPSCYLNQLQESPAPNLPSPRTPEDGLPPPLSAEVSRCLSSAIDVEGTSPSVAPPPPEEVVIECQPVLVHLSPPAAPAVPETTPATAPVTTPATATAPPAVPTASVETPSEPPLYRDITWHRIPQDVLLRNDTLSYLQWSAPCNIDGQTSLHTGIRGSSAVFCSTNPTKEFDKQLLAMVAVGPPNPRPHAFRTFASSLSAASTQEAVGCSPAPPESFKVNNLSKELLDVWEVFKEIDPIDPTYKPVNLKFTSDEHEILKTLSAPKFKETDSLLHGPLHSFAEKLSPKDIKEEADARSLLFNLVTTHLGHEVINRQIKQISRIQPVAKTDARPSAQEEAERLHRAAATLQPLLLPNIGDAARRLAKCRKGLREKVLSKVHHRGIKYDLVTTNLLSATFFDPAGIKRAEKQSEQMMALNVAITRHTTPTNKPASSKPSTSRAPSHQMKPKGPTTGHPSQKFRSNTTGSSGFKQHQTNRTNPQQRAGQAPARQGPHPSAQATRFQPTKGRNQRKPFAKK